jgi:hypothetical protein
LKKRKKELNLSEEWSKDEMEEQEFEIYNNRVRNQKDVADYIEVLEEEESHQIIRPEMNNEIVIIRNPSEYPLIPEADDNNFEDQES